jgi:hypothetical protein
MEQTEWRKGLEQKGTKETKVLHPYVWAYPEGEGRGWERRLALSS